MFMKNFNEVHRPEQFKDKLGLVSQSGLLNLQYADSLCKKTTTTKPWGQKNKKKKVAQSSTST